MLRSQAVDMMWTVLTILAVVRVARLITVDRLTRRVRDWAGGVERTSSAFNADENDWDFVRRPMVHYLFSCPWCMSIWIGGPIVTGSLLTAPGYDVTWSSIWLGCLLTFTSSAAAGLLVTVEDFLDRVWGAP